MASWRKTWQDEKKQAKKAGFDVSVLVRGADLGPLLDKVQAAVKAYDRTADREADERKAPRQAILDAVKDAEKAVGKYVSGVQFIADRANGTGAAEKAARDILQVLQNFGQDLEALERKHTRG